MKPKVDTWLTRIKDSWQVVLILLALASTIGVWVNLPKRVEAVETEVDDLKGWAREVQGYAKAQQEYAQQLQRQLPNQMAPRFQTFEEQDDTGTWWTCQAEVYQACWDEQRWRRVE